MTLCALGPLFNTYTNRVFYRQFVVLILISLFQWKLQFSLTTLGPPVDRLLAIRRSGKIETSQEFGLDVGIISSPYKFDMAMNGVQNTAEPEDVQD